jgi:glycosyltransferase involved in cell wall biosynthesis
MVNSMENQSSPTKLSICIATFNRGHVIGETLDSILCQAPAGCEIVVSDNASTDETHRVVESYAKLFKQVRYVRQSENTGMDRNFDNAVEMSVGEYCWLMSDDDTFKPGAIATVMAALRGDYSLVLVNYERRDFAMKRIILSKFLDVESDCVYGPEDFDRLFIATGQLLIYLGCVIIKRSIWMTRDRQRYYGTGWVQVGVIFQEPLPGDSLLIAAPLVSYREGNVKSYFNRFFEFVMVRWPSLLWSLAPSTYAKELVCESEPWRDNSVLLLLRAGGCYSVSDYRKWIRPKLSRRRRALPALIAGIPGILLNVIYVISYRMTRHKLRDSRLQFLSESPFYFRNLQIFQRKSTSNGC